MQPIVYEPDCLSKTLRRSASSSENLSYRESRGAVLESWLCQSSPRPLPERACGAGILVKILVGKFVIIRIIVRGPNNQRNPLHPSNQEIELKYPQAKADSLIAEKDITNGTTQ